MASAYLRKLRLLNRDVRLYLISMALIGFTIYGGIRSMLLNLYLVRSCSGSTSVCCVRKWCVSPP